MFLFPSPTVKAIEKLYKETQVHHLVVKTAHNKQLDVHEYQHKFKIKEQEYEKQSLCS